MKKYLFLFFCLFLCFILVAFSSCNTVEIPSLKKSVKADVFITTNDTDISAKLHRKNERITLRIISPSHLKNLTYTYENKVLEMSFCNLKNSVCPDYMPKENFIRTIAEFYSLVDKNAYTFVSQSDNKFKFIMDEYTILSDEYGKIMSISKGDNQLYISYIY